MSLYYGGEGCWIRIRARLRCNRFVERNERINFDKKWSQFLQSIKENLSNGRNAWSFVGSINWD